MKVETGNSSGGIRALLHLCTHLSNWLMWNFGRKLFWIPLLAVFLISVAYNSHIVMMHSAQEYHLSGLLGNSSYENGFTDAPAPKSNFNISPKNPVILFHQRKAGGSSLRRAMFNSARALNQSYFIPCYSPVPCDTYSFKNTRAAIYAGHFPISEVKHLLRHVPMESEFKHRQKHNFTCLTNFRDPISRVESCFYFRFMNRGIKYSCMNDIPVETLRRILVDGVDHYGDGCLDEPFRILSGISDKRLLRKSNDVLTPEFQISYQNTLHWLSRCHILVLEDQRTLQLSGSLIPELKDALDSLGHENKNKASKCQLDREHTNLLYKLTEAERRLYNAVQSRVNYLVEISGGLTS